MFKKYIKQAWVAWLIQVQVFPAQPALLDFSIQATHELVGNIYFGLCQLNTSQTAVSTSSAIPRA